MESFKNKVLAVFLSCVLALGSLFARVFPMQENAASFDSVNIGAGYELAVSKRAGTRVFNRVSLSYSADAPVRMQFSYLTKDGDVREEELLLSEKETEASFLLDGFLSGKTALRLQKLRFSPMEQRPECRFTLHSLRLGKQSVPSDTIYLENARFKLGVKLSWGGGISEFYDKSQRRYGNLLNQYDPGHMVQQSFYGPTMIPDYENGWYSDQIWCYNPVQGGDQYGNASKLVAVEQTDRQITVVCRPLDWAKNNVPTQTLFKSVYTLTETGVKAENTAIDFLQTPWTPRDQELPAFYTLSALGNFVFYDGDAMWTDAPLRYERELPFWGGQKGFALGENTETWCAWADDSDYGVGLYSPTATRLLAGRFGADGSADSNAPSTNYVAPVAKLALSYGEPFCYEYRFTAGTVSEIRAVFRELH